MGKRIHVAVYGTLKRGFENYERLLPGERPVLVTLAQLPYRLYAGAEYPMLVPDDTLGPVALEIYQVGEDKLRELDALEAPYGYRRESVYLESLGEDVEIYVHPAPAPEGFELVPDGEWMG